MSEKFHPVPPHFKARIGPSELAELHRRARGYYAARLHQGAPAQQHRTLADYIFLHRNNPVVRPFFAWQESGSMLPEPARPAE